MVYLYRSAIPNVDMVMENWLVETDLIGLVKQAYNVDRPQYWVCPSYDTVSKLDTLTPISLPMYTTQLGSLSERILVNITVLCGDKITTSTVAIANNLHTVLKKLFEDIISVDDINATLRSLLELDRVSISPNYQSVTPITIKGKSASFSICVPKYADLTKIIPGWVKEPPLNWTKSVDCPQDNDIRGNEVILAF